MASPYERFIRARDFLQRHRTDYATAYRDYVQPELDEFNWALDYFDTQARGNATPALWVVEEDGSERKITFFHRLSNVETGQLAMKSKVYTVMMDLDARRSTTIDAVVLGRARERLLPAGSDA